MPVGSLKQMLEEFSNGTYDFTDKGKCTQCGACCSDLLFMTDKEIETIRKYIKANNIKEHRHILPLAEPTIDLTCPFLNDGKKTEKCEIYEVRPRVCRDFICCPSKRPPVDVKYQLKARVVSVRDTFFTESED